MFWVVGGHFGDVQVELKDYKVLKGEQQKII